MSRTAALLLLCLLALPGCGETYHPDKAPKAQGEWHQTPSQDSVFIPADLSLSPAVLIQVLDEADSTLPLNSTTTTPGIPSGWKLIVHPGPYWHVVLYGQPAMWAYGHTDYAKKNLHVAYSGPGDPRLAALAHEIAHVYDGPKANHP